MTAHPGSQWALDLLGYLARLKSNHAAMADLRRGRGKSPEDAVQMHRWVSQFVGERQIGTGRERAVYLVSSLFALHQDLPRCDDSLGRSIRQAASSAGLSEGGLERRLLRLAGSRTSDDLCRRLPPLVSLVASSGAPISWARLAGDIDRWDTNKGAIARCWLRDFFAHFDQAQEPDAPALTEGAS